jgi:glycosyltransferase involved in cell wall biosynthesis
MELWKIDESYTDPFLIFEKAIKAGMTFVTLTDHNSIDGCLLLKERYGDKVLTGVESTTFFPEDGCKVHVLIYGMNEQQFSEIQKVRKDIYELREYVTEQNLAHSVAHATYSIQRGGLTPNHLEKLIVLFNVFETINGSRNRSDNIQWTRILQNLTPECLSDLCAKHFLEPFGDEPWKKGFTGGSDDHGGMFIGRTYTEVDAMSDYQVLRALREKSTIPGGRHSDYQSLAFAVYKVLNDSSTHKKNGSSESLANQVADMLLEGKSMGIVNRIRIKRLWMMTGRKENDICRSFCEFALTVQKKRFASPDEAIRFADATLSRMCDNFLKIFFTSIEENLAKIDIPGFMQKVTTSLPGIFLSMPFIFALRHLNENRMLVNQLTENLQINKGDEDHRRILWFTDTLYDLNGVSYTLNEIGRLAQQKNINLKIATSVDEKKPVGTLPSYILNLPFIHSFKLPYYEHYALKVPSVLRSLGEIYRYDPDIIYISTPGPVGLLGLMVARLMNIRSVGFYHTDFTLQTRKIVDDPSVANMLEAYTRWFYNATDEIRVPTKEYITVLTKRGFKQSKLNVFKRGIDSGVFLPHRGGKTFLKDRWGLNGDYTLLYVGRISKDKSLDFLLDAFHKIAEKKPSTKLILVGDGPYLQALKRKTRKAAGSANVLFTGRIDHEKLPLIYSGSDLFLFPSKTDTFGKAVLEAQACGLPAIVSDEGGPKELIVHGKTGFVVESDNIAEWVNKIETIFTIMTNNPGEYLKMKEDAREHIIKNHDWEDILNGLLSHAPQPDTLWEKMIA